MSYTLLLFSACLFMLLGWMIPLFIVKDPDDCLALMKVTSILGFLIFLFVAWNMQFIEGSGLV